jgi:hypothetical protein
MRLEIEGENDEQTSVDVWEERVRESITDGRSFDSLAVAGGLPQALQSRHSIPRSMRIAIPLPLWFMPRAFVECVDSDKYLALMLEKGAAAFHFVVGNKKAFQESGLVFVLSSQFCSLSDHFNRIEPPLFKTFVTTNIPLQLPQA